MHWTEEAPPNHGFWAVTRYEDIYSVERTPEIFTSTKYVNLEEVDDDLMDLRRSILETDGVRHRALRKLIQREFSQGPLTRKYEDFLRGLTKDTVDNALAEHRIRLRREDQRRLPDPGAGAAARRAGEPTPGMLIDWGNQMIGNTDPDYSEHLITDPDSDQYKHLPFRSPAALEVFEYGRELARQRKGGDGTDLISILVNRTPEDGEPITATDFDNYFLLLVIAGNETTRHTISQSMLALIEHQDQLRILQERPELIPARSRSSCAGRRRCITSAGPRPATSSWAASRSRRTTRSSCGSPPATVTREVFEDPYRFDVTRTNIDHVTFGKGSPHLCLGNALARMEIRLMFTELIPRLGSIELNGEVTRVRSNFVNGIKKFPVAVTTR